MTQALTSNGQRPASMAELLGAFAFANDLAFGLAQDDSVRSCYLAVRLAEQLELPAADRRVVYYASLLKDAGCTSWTSTLAEFWGSDEIAARRELVIFGGGSTLPAFLGWLVRFAGRDLPPHRRLTRMLQVARGQPEIVRNGFVAARDVAMRIAGRLEMPEDVCQAVCFIFERWDGQGMPDGASGTDIPIASRVVHPTFTLGPVHHRLGREAAIELAKRERGRAFDPDVADAFLALAADETFWADLESPHVWEIVLDREPSSPMGELTEDRLEQITLAFADFADLKAPQVLAHSRRVATLSESIARTMDCNAVLQTHIRRAALLHDLGLVAVPSWVLSKPEAERTAADRELVRLHPYHTERILSHVPALTSLVATAGLHHERMDGTGYVRGLPASQIPVASRVIAVADHFDVLTHEAPGRKPLPPTDALAALTRDSAAFAPDVVQALSATLGTPEAKPVHATWPAGLTDREVEVLRLAAKGLTRKEIGQQLVLSENTVRHHLEHIYNKVGVSSRVPAVMFAMEQGLID